MIVAQSMTLRTLHGIRHALSSVADFCANRRGNVGLLFAFTLPIILVGAGGAIDYSLRNDAYTKLMSCADEAALAAVSLQGLSNSQADAQAASLDFFRSTCPTGAAQLADVSLQKAGADVSDANGSRVASVSFIASRQTQFLQLIGIATLPIVGTSVAKGGSSSTPYIDFYALLDNSPSMGLGATDSDQTRLQALTPDQCAFACHIAGSATDYYSIARANAIDLRIDVLRSSWIKLVKQAKNSSSFEKFRFAAYTFNTASYLILALTGDYSSVLDSAKAIDLEIVPSTGPGSTHTDDVLVDMVPNIPVAGDGSSADKSRKYLIFVTDGVQDFDDMTTYDGHRTQAITSSRCEAFKNRGVQVAVIYTTYLAMSAGRYQRLVQPIADRISPSLAACASSGLYFQATSPADIASAFNAIYANATRTVSRLTN